MLLWDVKSLIFALERGGEREGERARERERKEKGHVEEGEEKEREGQIGKMNKRERGREG